MVSKKALNTLLAGAVAFTVVGMAAPADQDIGMLR